MSRSTNCLSKLDRMRKTLRHEEADRVPVSDFFWGSFLRRWRDELGLPADTDIYRYYDLDWVVVNPNVDPHIKPFEILRENEQEVLVRTGFEAVIRKRLDLPMPAFLEFDTNTVEKMEAFQFDDPWDERRYFRAGDDQINGVGDSFSRNTAPFVARIEEAYADFPVFGGVLEANEVLTRLIGPENSLQWMALYPDAMGRFIARIFEFSLATLKAQIQAASGKLDGMVIWGDVAYKKGLLFSPVFWRKHFKPGVAALIDECHSHDLPVIYHGCGNVNKIFADFVEIGVDAYNPLEAKAGMDVSDHRRRCGHRSGCCGNMDVQLWAAGTLDEIKAAALTKLNAAKGGGFIFQSDHSVPNDISGEKYDYVVKLIREHGTYPLRLGEYDLAMS